MLERFYNSRPFNVLRGKVITSVVGACEGGTRIVFTCSDGTEYTMYHQRDGEESVFVKTVDRLDCAFRAPDFLMHPDTMDDDPDTAEEWSTKNLLHTVEHVLCSGNPVLFAESVELEPFALPLLNHPHADPIVCRETEFLLATRNGVVAITWSGSADDETLSLEVDFVQTKGEGLWKE